MLRRTISLFIYVRKDTDFDNNSHLTIRITVFTHDFITFINKKIDETYLLINKIRKLS